MGADLEVKGLIELRAKAQQMARDIAGTPMLEAVRETALDVLAGARRNAPVDTGRLRASLTASVAAVGDTVQGVAGTNVTYALAQEFGARPHWPPVGALQPWANRHDMSAFLVARAISRRGLPARRYLGKAVTAAEPRFRRRIDRAMRQIMEKQ